MPAAKNSALNKRHDTKADKQKRESAEAALIPRTQLSAKDPPAELRSHKTARATWTRLVNLYSETQGTIITAFDQDLLIKYCLAQQELSELLAIRAAIEDAWKYSLKVLNGFKPDGKGEIKDHLAALQNANDLLKRFQGMDARVDGKRKLIFSFEQSLYLTPRSRAGVAPVEKPKEKPKSAMGKLLDGDKS